MGGQAVDRLAQARVCVFGVGGVGGFTVEALARAGVGALDIVDNDEVSVSNINRQIIATWDTVGRSKVQVMAERIASINPACRVTAAYDYVVDAIDTITGKLDLVEAAYAAGTPIVSAMGAGNKLDPTQFEVADIYDTSVCRLAKVMRRELRKRGIPALKCVYSKEEPIQVFAEELDEEPAENRRSVPGSVSFVPSVAGLIIAGEVIKDLVKDA